jgi:hypothetical protein
MVRFRVSIWYLPIQKNILIIDFTSIGVYNEKE